MEEWKNAVKVGRVKDRGNRWRARLNWGENKPGEKHVKWKEREEIDKEKKSRRVKTGGGME